MDIKIDPITYEVVKHKIWQNLWEGRATMELVSGSVVVTEAKEVLYGLYDGAGSIVASSAGLLVHITGGEEMIRNIITWYSENPGIYDGDVFFFNDPYVGGVHVPDAACIAPFFYEYKLTAWLVALFHTPEMGAVEPSSMMPNATEIFHEGIRCPGLKIMEKGKERNDSYKLLQRMVRDPGGITLDCKARVASLNVGKRRLKELFDKYGQPLMEEIFKQMIIDSEKVARAKLKKLPDGIWKEVIYGDHDGQRYHRWKICLTMEKKEDHLTLDFTGTDPQLPGPTNMSKQGLVGSVFTVLCTRLFYEEHWNKGILNVVDIIAPEKSLINCNWPAALNMSVFISGNVMNLLHSCISKMLSASNEFYEDQNATWMGNFVALFWGGLNQYGMQMGSILFDCLASGQGAGSVFDGVDTGCFIMTPEVIAGDVEMYESIMPFMYLCKRQAPDSAGPGKFRGGAGLEIIYKVHKTPGIKLIPLGLGKKTSMGPGLF
ncbi:MAG: hydantoinase B/oxoprolinase family protein, partial [Thermodesulfobacteriota bacterium]|nr:hydantoinase B/oxoprolinase family protein [Thermodesulfobacteriota bacterium]